MSVRSYDPKPAEIFPTAKCSEPLCGMPYWTICRLCNRAFCSNHLLNPHTCDTHVEFIVLTRMEVEELFGIPHVHLFKENGKDGHGRDRLSPCECGSVNLRGSI